MSGTSDTEYSSESGSVDEAVGPYYHYDVSITIQCFVIVYFGSRQTRDTT